MKKKIKRRKRASTQALSYWDQLISGYKPPGRKARPKQKATRKAQPKGNNMAKKDGKATAEEEAAEQAYLAEQANKPSKASATEGKPKAQQAEGDIQPREGEEYLPPPDPPFEESLPFPPPAPDAVSHEEKGAPPEDPNARRELNIAPESTPGEGPSPEAPEPEEGKKEENK
jgi:hypothetical protein